MTADDLYSSRRFIFTIDDFLFKLLIVNFNIIIFKLTAEGATDVGSSPKKLFYAKNVTVLCLGVLHDVVEP
jgi:hypothetical protein